MKTTVGHLRSLIREVAAPKKPDMHDVIRAIEAGLYSSDELKSINSYLGQAISKRHAEEEKAQHRGGLGDWESHQSMLDTLINDSWDDHAESAFVESLLALSGGEVYGARAKDDRISAEISKIIDAAGDASNLRSELEGMSDEEDEYFEYEKEYDKKWREANDGLQRFWSKYVEKKPAKKQVKKPAKKGR